MTKEELNSHQLEQDELGTLCICAERYAIGRRTYMPSLICGIIQSLVSELSDRDIYVLVNDIESQRDRAGGLGDEFDKIEWMRLCDALKAEQERRKEDNE